MPYDEHKNLYCVSFGNGQHILAATDSDMAVIEAQRAWGAGCGDLLSVVILGHSPANDIELRVGPDGRPVRTPPLPEEFVRMRRNDPDLWRVVDRYRERSEEEHKAAREKAHRMRFVKLNKDGLPSRSQRGMILSLDYFDGKWHLSVSRLGASSSLGAAANEGELLSDTGDCPQLLSDRDMMVIEAWEDHQNDYIDHMAKKTGQFDEVQH
jgi:hypothetical protein